MMCKTVTYERIPCKVEGQEDMFNRVWDLFLTEINLMPSFEESDRGNTLELMICRKWCTCY